MRAISPINYLPFKGSLTKQGKVVVRKDLVDIIIPNAGGESVLRRLIDSMRKYMNYTIKNSDGGEIPGFRLIIISQGEYGSYKFLRELESTFANVFPIYNDKNTPPPVPYNEGLEYSARVMYPLSEYIMFLDDDMVLTAEDLIDIEKNWLNKYNFDNVATEHCFFGDNKDLKDNGEAKDFGMGSFFFRRKIFEKIGYLDERFTFHCSDSDWNRRVRLAGGRIAVVPDTARLMVHQHQAGTHNVFKGNHQEVINNDWKIFRDKWDIPSEEKMVDKYQEKSNAIADIDPNHPKHIEIAKMGPLGRMKYLYD